MKRFAIEEREMARMLLLVSSQQGHQHEQYQLPSTPVPLGGGGRGAPGAPAERAFVCKTCDRVFPSFQALGGHRASHKKPRLDGDGSDLAKPKLHGCSVCGLEFAVGQALGGHMRRHRAMAGAGMAPATGVVVDKNKSCSNVVVDVVGGGGGIKRELVWLDLNHPPCDGDGELSDADGDCGFDAAAGHGLTFHQFLDTGAMAVDCVGY